MVHNNITSPSPDTFANPKLLIILHLQLMGLLLHLSDQQLSLVNELVSDKDCVYPSKISLFSYMQHESNCTSSIIQ